MTLLCLSFYFFSWVSSLCSRGSALFFPSFSTCSPLFFFPLGFSLQFFFSVSARSLGFFSCSSFSPVFLSSFFRWFGVCSWRRIIRLTNACSFPALHLRFENKGKAGLLSFCSLPISLFLGPLSVFVHAPHWPLGSALFFSSSVAHSFSLFFFCSFALSHLLWLYSQRMPSTSTIETASKPLLQKPFLWKETKKATADF